MHNRLTIAALAATFNATIATPTAAEPTKAPGQQAAQPAEGRDNRPVEVLLASSEIRPAGQQSDQTSPPAKRPRAARVTSCRCGDQTTPQQP